MDKEKINPRQQLEDTIREVYKRCDTHVINLNGYNHHASVLMITQRGLLYSHCDATDSGYSRGSRDIDWKMLCEIANTIGVKLTITE